MLDACEVCGQFSDVVGTVGVLYIVLWVYGRMTSMVAVAMTTTTTATTVEQKGFVAYKTPPAYVIVS